MIYIEINRYYLEGVFGDEFGNAKRTLSPVAQSTIRATGLKKGGMRSGDVMIALLCEKEDLPSENPYRVTIGKGTMSPHISHFIIKE